MRRRRNLLPDPQPYWENNWGSPRENRRRRNLNIDPQPYGQYAYGRQNPGGCADHLHVNVWEERDRLSIIVTDDNDNPIAEWWDDDARQMFEDGFFRRGRGLVPSVIAYVEEHGMCHPRQNLLPDPQPYGEHLYGRANPMRFNGDAPRPTLTTASVFLRWLRRSQEAGMIDATIEWGEEGKRAKVNFKDGSEVTVNSGGCK